jgi:DNA-3-methyladenine glycosylase II
VSRIAEHFGGRLPSPAELLAADPHVLRASGLSARKGETLRALAERFVDGRLSDEVLSQMTDDEVEAVLTEVPGIGPWTAHGFLLVALDRPDVFMSGDLALRRAIQRAYGLDHAPTEDEVLELAERWRPYRSLAVSYLFASQYDGGI